LSAVKKGYCVPSTEIWDERVFQTRERPFPSKSTYREVLTIDKPDIRLRSANMDASKTVEVDLGHGKTGGIRTLIF
jgi:hypothetical protein